MRIAFAASVSAAAIACGGGSSTSSAPTGSATFNGTLHAHSFSPRDAVSAKVSGPGGDSTLVVLGSTPGLCAQLGAGTVAKSSQFVALTAERIQTLGQPTTQPNAPGTYSLIGDPVAQAFAIFIAIDDKCQELPDSDSFGTSGTVTFTSVGNHYAGTFDITFDFSDHATGTFDAPDCPALNRLVGQARFDLACQ